MSKKRVTALARNLEKDLAKDVKTARAARKLKKNLADKNFRLDISPDMMMVKDFYWAMRLEDMEITPQQAATKCGIKPSAVDEWFYIEEVKEWFEEAPLKMKPQLKALSMMALRKGRELLQGDDARAQKAMEFFIDHATGKAKEKAANSLMDEDEDLAGDIAEVNRIMEKLDAASSSNSE